MECCSPAGSPLAVGVGADVLVRAGEDGNWYKAKVRELEDATSPKALVHYKRWSAKWDEWVYLDRGLVKLDLPEAIMSDNTLILHEPVRPGDVISHHQVLRAVSDPKTTKLGSGRFWEIDIVYENQDGDLVGIESYTGFGYRRPEGGDQ